MTFLREHLEKRPECGSADKTVIKLAFSFLLLWEMQLSVMMFFLRRGKRGKVCVVERSTMHDMMLKSWTSTLFNGDRLRARPLDTVIPDGEERRLLQMREVDSSQVFSGSRPLASADKDTLCE